MLHAKGRVGGMSVLAVATKVVWAVGRRLGDGVRGAGLWAYAASLPRVGGDRDRGPLDASRGGTSGFAFRVDVPATKAMLVTSLPYYLNSFATTAYGKLDVTLLEFSAAAARSAGTARRPPSRASRCSSRRSSAGC